MSYSDLPHKPTIPVEPFKLSIPDEDIKVPHILLKSTRIAKESYENVSAENNKFGITKKCWWIWKMNGSNWIGRSAFSGRQAIKPNEPVHWHAFHRRKQEDGINSLPAFKAKFKKSEDSVFSIHFTALFSKKTYAIPIILSHGWPGSFEEFIAMMVEVCFEAVRNTVQQFSPRLISSNLRNSLNGIYGLPCTSYATSGSDFQQTSFLFFGSIFASIPCPSAESRSGQWPTLLAQMLSGTNKLLTFFGFDKNNQLEAYFTGTKHTKKFTFNLVFWQLRLIVVS